MPFNIEIKARTTRQAAIRDWLLAQGADFRGTDLQKDTYFHCTNGRLKLRQGTIENNLIFYRRPDQEGPKGSEVNLANVSSGPEMELLLQQALGVWKVVEKSREIYFIENVKFHLDRLAGLGEFVEIEAIDADGSVGETRLRAQCDHYMEAFGIQPADLLSGSYSDMVSGT